MRSPSLRMIALVAGLAGFVALWLFFAPTQLGGSATYSTTSGISMEPLLHKGDLAIVRAQRSYRVGEVVLYRSPVLHRPVLHRIIVIQDGHYFFKGDNNGFVDPGYVTRGELIGALWLHLPEAGTAVAWMGEPLHAALLSGLAAAFLLLGGATTSRRRKRRRGGSSASARPTDAVAPAAVGLEVRRPSFSIAPGAIRQGGTEQSRLAYLLSGTALVPFCLNLLLAGAILAVGYSADPSRTVQAPDAYRHQGAFSYSARVIKPSDLYPTGTAATGAPLFTSLFRRARVEFAYRFESGLPHRISGTIALKALILAQETSWQSLYTLAKPAPFSGDSAATASVIDLRQLYTIVDHLTTSSGEVGADYTVDLQAIVHVHGVVGDKRVDETFSPVLPFSVSQSMIKLEIAPPTAPPGATYAPPSANATLVAATNPVQAGSVPRKAANLLNVARYRIAVPAIRLLGLLVLALAFVMATLHVLLVRRKVGLPQEALIARHFRAHVVPVASLEQAQGSAPLEVLDFTILTRLACYLERPILLATHDGERTYALDDNNGSRYVYRVPMNETQRVREEAPAERAGRLFARVAVDRRRPRPAAIRVLGVLVFIGVTATLVTSFTATTNVPTSAAGASSFARQFSQLTPAGCSSLTLTSLVVKSGTFTNTASNALVLGSAGKDTITDNGAHNCIVGGGGSDTVTAVASDICIKGPSSGATYKKCATA